MFNLKAGYRVKTSNGFMWIVIPGNMVRHCAIEVDGMILARNSSHCSILFEHDHGYDIVEVYDIPSAGGYALDTFSHGSLLWSKAESDKRAEAIKQIEKLKVQVATLNNEIYILEATLA